MNHDEGSGAVRNRLQWQLAQDCKLLEQLKVMDYSLLLGVTMCNPGYGSSPPTDRVGLCCQSAALTCSMPYMQSKHRSCSVG